MEDQSTGTLPLGEQPKHEAPSAAKAAPVTSKAVTPAATPPPAAQEVALTPNQKTIALVGGLLNKKMNALQNFLGSKENALRFMSSVMKCIEANPALLKCKPESLMGALMEAAGLRFYVGDYSGDCYIIPYGDVAQFQLGYRGLKTLAYRSGLLRAGTEMVYEKDKFKEELGTLQRLTHARADGDRGAPIGAYAWAEVTPGKIVFRYMTEDQIMEIKKLSQGATSKYSPWNSKQDPEKWMWQKTAWKQLAKMIPTSDQLDRAVYLDNVAERGGYIESEGVVVEVPFEKTQDDRIDEGKGRKEALRKAKGVTQADHE